MTFRDRTLFILSMVSGRKAPETDSRWVNPCPSPIVAVGIYLLTLTHRAATTEQTGPLNRL